MSESYAGGSNLVTGSTAQTVSPNKLGRRVMIAITNYGSNLAWLMFSNNQIATVGYGTPVYPGQTIADSSSDIYKCWQGMISVIQDTTGTTTLSISERVVL